MAGVRDLRSQLQVVSGLVVWRAVGAQGEHAAGETGQVAHFPLQVAVLPLADERQAAVGFAYQVALDGLRRGGGKHGDLSVIAFAGRKLFRRRLRLKNLKSEKGAEQRGRNAERGSEQNTERERETRGVDMCTRAREGHRARRRAPNLKSGPRLWVAALWHLFSSLSDTVNE